MDCAWLDACKLTMLNLCLKGCLHNWWKDFPRLHLIIDNAEGICVWLDACKWWTDYSRKHPNNSTMLNLWLTGCLEMIERPPKFPFLMCSHCTNWEKRCIPLFQDTPLPEAYSSHDNYECAMLIDVHPKCVSVAIGWVYSKPNKVFSNWIFCGLHCQLWHFRKILWEYFIHKLEKYLKLGLKKNGLIGVTYNNKIG